MAKTTVSVSFINGFVGDASSTGNAANNASYLTALGWSNIQFQQESDTGLFGMQGNDLIGTLLITDAAGIQHRMQGVINWRAPSGTVTTIVFYSLEASNVTLATAGGGSYVIDPYNAAVSKDKYSFVGLTFNGSTLAIGSDGTVSGNAAAKTVINDLNGYLANQPQLKAGDVSVDEGSGTAYVTVTLSKPTTDTVTVKYTTQDGSAHVGADYAASTGTLIFAPNETSKQIPVSVIDNATADGARTVSVVLCDSVFAAITDSTGVLTISDNDTGATPVPAPVPAASVASVIADGSVTEGSPLVYTVTLSGAGGEHSFAIGGTASAGDRGAIIFSDGVAWKNGDPATGMVVVPAGLGSFKVSVATIDDSAVESTETVIVTVGGKSATGGIADNDSVSVSVSTVIAEDTANLGAVPLDSAVIEGGSLRYTVQLNAAAVAPTEFHLTLGGNATAADLGAIDFSDNVAWKDGDPATGIVVVPANVASFKITIATIDDSAVEAAETLTVTVGGVAAEGAITDNDSVSVASVIAEDAGAVGLSPVDSTVTEGEILRYSVLLNAATVAATEIALTIGGTADADDLAGMVFSDNVNWKNNDAHTGILVVPAGVGSFKITVGTKDDTAIEHTESLTLTVGGVPATGNITDNDSQSVSTLVAENAANLGATPVDSNVVEGGVLQFSATLNGRSPVATEYTLVLGGSASAADLGTLSFSNGVAWKNGDPHTGIVVVPAEVSAFTATLPTMADGTVESTETVSMTLGGVLATGTIADNDSLNVSSVVAEDAASHGLSPIDSTVTEGATLLYTVTLNAAAVAPAEFSLVLGGTVSDADVGALSFSDGVTWKNGDPHTGIVVVPVGVASFTVTLPTIDDSIEESSESAVLSVNGVHATGTVLDNDLAILAPVPAPTPAPAPALQGSLDPATDDGASSSDAVTSVRTPEFTIQGGQLLQAGGSVQLLSPAGEVVSTGAVSAADVAAGKINVSPGALDDGVYTYTVQVLDAGGKVVGSAPVSVTVVTDLDGVMPSVELAAYGGDYNKDGVLDWQQNAVALLPLGSLADFAQGVNAPLSSFGAVIAGSVGTSQDTVHLTSGAQLRDLSLTDLPSRLPTEYRAASPVFNFTVTATQDAGALPDLDPSRPGLQTRVVIELGQTGVASNDFLKFDKATGTWFSYLDDQNLATFDDGATLVDLNNDGRIDRIVITLTDGGRGDEDGVANGVIVDPGLLTFDKTLPAQVYSIRTATGELYYTADVKDAATHAAGAGNVFQGVVFDSMRGQPGAQHYSAWYQPFTQDTTYAADGKSLPYACYGQVAGSSGFDALGSGSGAGVAIHLYQDAAGHTELMSVAQAQQEGLAAKAYTDRGARFEATMNNAFSFDVEGYLVANHDNEAVQALVRQLAASYQSTSAAGFIEAVEQNYFQQIQLVGVAHGAAATAADLNAMFGTSFGN